MAHLDQAERETPAFTRRQSPASKHSLRDCRSIQYPFVAGREWIGKEDVIAALFPKAGTRHQQYAAPTVWRWRQPPYVRYFCDQFAGPERDDSTFALVRFFEAHNLSE
jgi:hypothetical protein